MKKTAEILTAGLFCLFLLGMAAAYLFQPEKTFSEREKRYLAEKPALTAENILSGDWGEEAEAYLADHMPGRDFFVGLNAYFEKYTFRQKAKDIWIQDGCLLEAPKKMDPATIEKNMRASLSFREKTELPLDLMIIPTPGFLREIPEYEDGEILDAVCEKAGSKIQTVDLRQVLTPDHFYKTDHHWTSEGAYQGYKTYVNSLGMTPRQDFQKETHQGFQGSAYSRSGLWLTPGEPIELYLGSEDLTAEVGEAVHRGIFWRENLQKEDKYTVFLGGNHPLVRIKNPNGQGKLLVIRDSFSNCLGGFLAEFFEEVVLVDLRYYKQPVSALAELETFDRVLVCYGIQNFLTDRNIVFLQR